MICTVGVRLFCLLRQFSRTKIISRIKIIFNFTAISMHRSLISPGNIFSNNKNNLSKNSKKNRDNSSNWRNKNSNSRENSNNFNNSSIINRNSCESNWKYNFNSSRICNPKKKWTCCSRNSVSLLAAITSAPQTDSLLIKTTMHHLGILHSWRRKYHHHHSPCSYHHNNSKYSNSHKTNNNFQDSTEKHCWQTKTVLLSQNNQKLLRFNLKLQINLFQSHFRSANFLKLKNSTKVQIALIISTTTMIDKRISDKKME